jgi:hypothetical protein
MFSVRESCLDMYSEYFFVYSSCMVLNSFSYCSLRAAIFFSTAATSGMALKMSAVLTIAILSCAKTPPRGRSIKISTTNFFITLKISCY